MKGHSYQTIGVKETAIFFNEIFEELSLEKRKEYDELKLTVVANCKIRLK